MKIAIEILEARIAEVSAWEMCSSQRIILAELQNLLELYKAAQSHPDA